LEYHKETNPAYPMFTKKAFLKKVRMSYYPGQYQPATPSQTFIGLAVLVLFAAFLCAIAASALAAGMVSIAPGAAASLASPILCPAKTTSTKLVTLNIGYSTSNTDSSVLKCYNAQGTELAGNGDSFTGLWWGVWMGTAALVGAVLSSIPDTKGKNAQTSKPNGVNETTRGKLEVDEELDELKMLVDTPLEKNKQKKVNT
jgi:hypothetical protein